MKTTIDNNQRVFLVKRIGYFTNKAFCNLKDIPAVIAEMCENNDEYIIYEYWNDKFKKCSKKHLNEMFVANQVNLKF